MTEFRALTTAKARDTGLFYRRCCHHHASE